MNWYKKAQIEQDQAPVSYFNVGHVGEDKNILWISDKSGGNFRAQEVNFATRVHNMAFGPQTSKSIWGRYDPIKNMVSIALPNDPRIPEQSIDPEELPNRLMDRLVSEFPGATIYGFGRESAIRII